MPPLNERIRSDSTASRLTSQTTQSTRTAATSASSYMYSTVRSSQGTSSHDSFLSLSSRSQADSTTQLFAQDHAKLKDAWEEMLSQRFLTPRLLNVLPFYLSSLFTNVHVYPTMQIVLPPPSHQRGSRNLAEPAMRPDSRDNNVAKWVEDMRARTVNISEPKGTSNRGSSTDLRASKPPVAIITLWSALHLARQVRVVSACKEAIWEAYYALNGAPRDIFLHPEDNVKERPKDDLREEFEGEWAAWER